MLQKFRTRNQLRLQIAAHRKDHKWNKLHDGTNHLSVAKGTMLKDKKMYPQKSSKVTLATPKIHGKAKSTTSKPRPKIVHNRRKFPYGSIVSINGRDMDEFKQTNRLEASTFLGIIQNPDHHYGPKAEEINEDLNILHDSIA